MLLIKFEKHAYLNQRQYNTFIIFEIGQLSIT